MPRFLSPSRFHDYVLAVVFTFVALAVRQLLSPWLLDSLPFATLFAAVAASVWMGGLGPAIVCAVLGFVATTMMYWGTGKIPPADNAQLVVRFATYGLSCAIIIAFGVARAVAHRRAESASFERARAEREQQVSQALFDTTARELNALLNASPLAIVMIDPDALIVRLWNPAAERLFGWKADEIIGHCLPIVPEDKLQECREYRERLTQGKSATIETYRLRRDGTRVPVVVAAASMPDAVGRTHALLLMFSDISERKAAEQALRESEATLRAFYDSAPFGMGVVELTDGDDILHIVDNAVTCQLFGVPPGGTSGRRATELAALRSTIDHWRERYQQSERENRPVRFEFHLKTPSGEQWWSAVVCPIGVSPRGRMRFSYVTEDVTARHYSDTRLRESEANARLALDVARIGTWNWSPSTNVVVADARCREICGFDLHAPLTLDDVRRRIHPEDWPRVEKALLAALQPDGDGRYGDEFRFVHADGSIHWVVSQGHTLFESRGATCGAERVLGTVLDITERKHHEDMLRQVDRRKDEFLATLAHELRNPLAPIRNGLQVLRLAEHDPHAIRQAREMMDRQLGHMVRLIDDLLDLSRISGGKVELRRARIDIADIVRNAVETSRPLIEAGQHALEVVLPTEPLIVDADLTRLAQIFSNLLNNAAKYTSSGGRIRIEAARENHEAVVRVRDNGVGIPADMLPHVFEMFMQVDRSLERSQSGLGIGLTIAQRLTQKHGGRIEARSEGAGRGSEFIVRLPLVESASTTTVSVDGPAHASSTRRKVLIADDNRDAALSLAMMLDMMGHETRTAHDGVEALEHAADFHPDVVLLDIGMPRLNGYDAARQLREQHGGERMLLIALTGWGQDEDKRRSKEAGFDVHLVKPVEPGSLETVIASIDASA
ncbi:MAG TPA: PAS domain S-box protein [Burkholderiaceae bacterium]|nr:PAS domain S-box protein [Burkholderiaceae bacterium]